MEHKWMFLSFLEEDDKTNTTLLQFHDYNGVKLEIS